MTISARGSLVTATAVVALALGGCAGAPATSTTAAASGGGTAVAAGAPRPRPTAEDHPMPAGGGPARAVVRAPPVAQPRRRPPARPADAAPGQNRGAFADPKVRAALQACGITLPTRPPGANGGGPDPPPPPNRPLQPTSTPTPAARQLTAPDLSNSAAASPRRRHDRRAADSPTIADSPCRYRDSPSPIRDSPHRSRDSPSDITTCRARNATRRQGFGDSPSRIRRLAVRDLGTRAGSQQAAEAITATRPLASRNRASAATSRRPPCRTATSTAIPAPSAATPRTNVTS